MVSMVILEQGSGSNAIWAASSFALPFSYALPFPSFPPLTVKNEHSLTTAQEKYQLKQIAYQT